MKTKEKIKSELVDVLKATDPIIKFLQGNPVKENYSFHLEYQSWYTKTLPIVSFLAPDRISEFKGYYEIDPKRKTLGYGTFAIQDYLKGTAPSKFNYPEFDSKNETLTLLYNQYTILGSLLDRIDSVLSSAEESMYSELQDAELNVASSLIKTSPRAAGALAGVILEGYLQKIAKKHDVTIRKKSPTLNDLNEPLKQASVYDVPTWRKISYLADIRNLCSHKKTEDPTVEQVNELVDGVNWVIKNVF